METSTPNLVNNQKLLSFSLLVAGCFQILLGIGSIVLPTVGALTLEVLLGIFLLLTGVAELMFAWELRAAPDSIWRFLRSAFFLLAGVILLSYPLSGLMTIALILGVLFLVDGALRLYVASQIESNRTILSLDGALGILLGLIVLLNWPGDSAFIIGILVGIRLIFSGMALMFVGSAMRAV